MNVGVSWLWSAIPYWSLDYGGQLERFSAYEDEHQFAAVAERLTIRAVEEAKKLCDRFGSLAKIALQINPDERARGQSIFHAAVAAGLAGDRRVSRRLFIGLIEEQVTAAWQVKLRDDCTELEQKLHEAS